MQLRIHPRDVQGRPHELVLEESAKYLGSILHVGANNKDELRNRVTQANTVHGRLTPRVWRSSSIPLPLKIRLWQTLVLTKGLYAVEIRVLGRADLLYLERWQIKKLRHLARGPVHITRETSEALRRRVQIPTIESQLRVRRLKYGGNFLPRVSLQLHEIALSRVTLGMPALLSARLCLARFLLRPHPSDHGAPTPTARRCERTCSDALTNATDPPQF